MITAITPHQIDALANLGERINSGQWWIVPVVSQSGLNVARAIEQTYYAGPKNQHFDALLLQPERTDLKMAVLLCTARKFEMLPTELLAMPLHFLTITKGSTTTHDIIVAFNTDTCILAWLAREFFKGHDGMKAVADRVLYAKPLSEFDYARLPEQEKG